MTRIERVFWFPIFPLFLLATCSPIVADLADLPLIAQSEIIEQHRQDLETLVILYRIEYALRYQQEELSDLLRDLCATCPQCCDGEDLADDP